MISKILKISLATLVFVSGGANALSVDSRMLAECEFVYLYSSQLLQLGNNSGGSINFARRSSMMSAANIMLSAKNDVISKDIVKSWYDLRVPLKIKIEKSQNVLDAYIKNCENKAMPLALRIRDERKMVFGMDFDSLQMKFFQDHRKNLGL